MISSYSSQVLYTSVLVLKVQGDVGVATAAIVAPVTSLCLVLFGEILPKSISYANAERVSVSLREPSVR
jgi:Mg2+/Co2+ transporter CorB